MSYDKPDYFFTTEQMGNFQFECLRLALKLQILEGCVTLAMLSDMAASALPSEVYQSGHDRLVLRRIAATAARDAGCYVTQRIKIGKDLQRTIWSSPEVFMHTKQLVKQQKVYRAKARFMRKLMADTAAQMQS